MPMNENEQSQSFKPCDWDRYFETTDFDLSVTLVCKNYVLESIETGKGGKLVFLFNKEKDIASAVDEYWSNKILVNPLEFTNVRKNLKSRIYGMKKNY